MRQDSEHALSELKSNSFVLKWKRVVSVLSPLSLFSHGGSHILVSISARSKLNKKNNKKEKCQDFTETLATQAGKTS